MEKNQNALIIFVKYPEPGKVKTRLANKIGKENAAKIYSLLAKFIINKLALSKHYETFIFFTPENKKEETVSWIGNHKIKYYAQKGKSLGDKISSAFKQCFELKRKNIVIIGTDCIEIDQGEILKTLKMLEKNEFEIVIGPSNDGGYYLLGLSKYHNFLFDQIDWSTNKVFDQTISKINIRNLKYGLLKEKNDIDEFQDIILKKIEKIDLKLASEINQLI